MCLKFGIYGGVGVEKLTLRNLLRLFYRFMVDFIPVVNGSGELKGVLLKSRLVSLTGGDLKDIDRLLTEDFVSSFLDNPDEVKVFLPGIVDRRDVKIPVLTESGELYDFWNGGDLLEAFGGKKVLPVSFFASFLDRLPYAIGLFNDKGDFIYFNALFKRMLENNEVKEEHMKRMRSFDKGQSQSLELLWDGRKWSGSLIPFYDGNRLSGGAFFWEDVTEIDRILSRAIKLAAFQRSFERIFNFIHEGFWCVDKLGKVIYCNSSFERIFGFSSARGKHAEELFGESWRSFPIYVSLEKGEEAFKDKAFGDVGGRRLCLTRWAVPIVVNNVVIGAMEIVVNEPFRDTSEVERWLELGKLSREALTEGVKAIKEGSVFIWGPPGVGKTLLGMNILGGERIVFIDGVLPKKLDDGVLFVENLESFDPSEKERIVELISCRRSVVTSRLPVGLFPGLSGSLFRAVIYLPPISERWDEVESFLKLRFGEKLSERGFFDRIRLMEFKENFRDLSRFVEKVISGESSLEDVLGEGFSLKAALEKKERELISSVLSLCGGNITKAAKMLGIPRQTLQYKIKRFGLRGAS